MYLLGHVALTVGVLASLFVQYKFYIVRDRSQTTFAVLAAANFLLLTAARTLPVDLPGFVTALLWFGFLFGLAVAIFHEHLPIRE